MKNVIILLCSALICPSLSGQEFTGFWEITEVKVGERIMTPVAKWTKIHKDGTFQSGNGWQQNAEGKWAYDSKKHEYHPVGHNEVLDPYGPFKLRIHDTKMYWTRMEEDMEVTVSLQRTDQLPKGPADLILGLWDLVDIEQDGESQIDSQDPDGLEYIFIRHDRLYNKRSPSSKRLSGYWHVDGHRPHLTFISHQSGIEQKRWKVVVESTSMTLTGISDNNKNVEKTYKRIFEFPQ